MDNSNLDPEEEQVAFPTNQVVIWDSYRDDIVWNLENVKSKNSIVIRQ